MFGTNSTITGVTMSHPSQLATFSPTPPPPIFTHSMVTTGDGLLQPVTCMGLVATSSAASVPGSVPLPPQQQQHQQQQQQLTAANGGNGSIVGMGMSLYGSDVVSVSLMYFPNSWTLLLLLVDSEPVVKATRLMSKTLKASICKVDFRARIFGSASGKGHRGRGRGGRQQETFILTPHHPHIEGIFCAQFCFRFSLINGGRWGGKWVFAVGLITAQVIAGTERVFKCRKLRAESARAQIFNAGRESA